MFENWNISLFDLIPTFLFSIKSIIAGDSLLYISSGVFGMVLFLPNPSLIVDLQGLFIPRAVVIT